MNERDWQTMETMGNQKLAEVTDTHKGKLKLGDRVKLQPRPGGDIFDIVLAGKTATIEAIEQDYDNKIHLAVILDDDPGKDLGWLRQPGHRFFFSLEEVELINSETITNIELPQDQYKKPL